MPMKLFVICVGDLATVGGSVLVVTPVESLSDSYSLCLWGLGTRFPPRWLTFVVAELSSWEVVMWAGHHQEWDAQYLDTYWAGA